MRQCLFRFTWGRLARYEAPDSSSRMIARRAGGTSDQKSLAFGMAPGKAGRLLEAACVMGTGCSDKPTR